MAKKKSTSYKEMLRDRVPKTVELALLFCKCKNLWIDHVYDNFIRIHVHKKDRYDATRICLGISGRNRDFNFSKTIMWDNMSEEETADWTNVCTWVEYFQENYQIAENEVKLAKITNPEIWYQDIEKLVIKALPDQADNYPLIRFIALSLTTK